MELAAVYSNRNFIQSMSLANSDQRNFGPGHERNVGQLRTAIYGLVYLMGMPSNRQGYKVDPSVVSRVYLAKL